MDLWMQYVMERFSDLGSYLSETSKYENIEMTMVAKMKLIYPPTITNMGQTIMCISSPRIKWVGNQNQRRSRREQSKRKTNG